MKVHLRGYKKQRQENMMWIYWCDIKAREEKQRKRESVKVPDSGAKKEHQPTDDPPFCEKAYILLQKIRRQGESFVVSKVVRKNIHNVSVCKYASFAIFWIWKKWRKNDDTEDRTTERKFCVMGILVVHQKRVLANRNKSGESRVRTYVLRLYDPVEKYFFFTLLKCIDVKWEKGTFLKHKENFRKSGTILEERKNIGGKSREI